MVASPKINDVEHVDATEGAQDQAPLSEADILNQILSGPKDAVAVGESLPVLQRARIAAFCYNRVHMREMGLRLASSCDLMSLKAAFGRAGEVVFKQSRDVDDTLNALKNSPGNQPPKPVTLKNVIS